MHKLKGRRGASLAISLIILIICAGVGVIVMTVLSANMKRTLDMKERNQKYLTISSAAQLLRDTFSEGIYEGTAKLTSTEDKETQETSYIFSGLGEGTYRGRLSSWVEKSLNDIYYARSSDIWQVQEGSHRIIPEGKQDVTFMDLTVNVETDKNTELETVYWTLTIKNDYSIEAVFWLEGEEYKTILTLPAEVSEEISVKEKEGSEAKEEVRETTCHVYITWPCEGAEFARVP